MPFIIEIDRFQGVAIGVRVYIKKIAMLAVVGIGPLAACIILRMPSENVTPQLPLKGIGAPVCPPEEPPWVFASHVPSRKLKALKGSEDAAD